MSKDDLKKNGISRRNFVKTLGVGTAVAAGAAMAGPLGLTQQAQAFTGSEEAAKIPGKWDLEADIVVLGAGAAGLPAAIRARDKGASVIVVDCNYDIGGHAITSGGNIPLGGGTSWQKKYGIKDDPDTLFQDLVDWSAVGPNGQGIYRYNDRAIHRVMADNMAPTFEFLIENGVRVVDKAPDNFGANGTGVSALREHHTVWSGGCSAEAPAGANGTHLMRDLEASARKKGVKFLLNYHMDVIYREKPSAGRVLGIKASYTPTVLPGSNTPLPSYRTDGNIELKTPTVTVRAKKAIFIGTGGNSGNVNFRRIADPRLTAEYALAAGEYSPQDASGELAAMAIGGMLWGTANETLERWGGKTKRPIVGVRTSYVPWDQGSPLFPKIKYTGLNVRNWQNGIIVNQAGKRFYTEIADGGYPNSISAGYYDQYGGYKHGDWRNTIKAPYKPNNWVDAALALNEGSDWPDFSAGPQWAILDSEGARRERWKIEADSVDPEYFFSAGSIAELAAKVSANPWQKYKMDGKVLEETVRRYNSFVDKGVDEDFDKPKPLYKIEKAPFYIGWCSVVVHDTYMGLRVDPYTRVLNLEGEPIPGLYCGGESAGGCSAHGLARCLTQGYIAGEVMLKG